MEVSRCCGAPIVVEYHSDLPNYTDDDYDLRIPVWVCSMCGLSVVVDRETFGREKDPTDRK